MSPHRLALLPAPDSFGLIDDGDRFDFDEEEIGLGPCGDAYAGEWRRRRNAQFRGNTPATPSTHSGILSGVQSTRYAVNFATSSKVAPTPASAAPRLR